jgi:hypothetical protein
MTKKIMITNGTKKYIQDISSYKLDEKCETRSPLDWKDLADEIYKADEALDYCVGDLPEIDKVEHHPCYKSIGYHLRKALQLIEDSNGKS